MMKSLLMTTTLAATLLGVGTAFSAPAIVTTTLNLRTGPGTGYAVETAMPDGAVVDVSGCIRGYGWCRVHWAGYDGWASSHYLAFHEGRYRGRSVSVYGARIGIPLIAGAIIGSVLGNDDNHHDWRHHDRHDRHDWHPRRRHDRDGHDRHDRERHDRDHHDRGRHDRDHDSRRDHHRPQPSHADHDRRGDHHGRHDDHRRHRWQHDKD